MLATSTIIAGIGLGIAAAGAATTAIGTAQTAEASKKEEKLRETQMNLDAYRKRRETIRQMILQQAAGKSNAANQGVSLGDSAVIGAGSQQTSSANRNISDINQSQQIGKGIFQANAAQAAGQATQAWGAAGQTIGGGIMTNSATIARVGATAGLWQDGY